ncbi:MAG: serine hydrolase domain-containing protein, partial [Planctomycetota bacterium]
MKQFCTHPLLLSIFFVLICNQGLQAQVIKIQEVDVSAAEAPMASAPFADYIEKARNDWQVPGMAVAIVKDGQVVLAKGFGVREAGKPEQVDADTLFAIASNTKAFTSAALAMLVDEGKIGWDDHVTDYLPWLRLKDPMTRDMRIRDLLCHRSGLGTFSGDLVWWGTDYSPKEVLERAAELNPAAAFRAKYGYTNLMFLAAGLVIEEASGQSWSDFVTSRILQPVQMNRTVASVKGLLSKGNFATPHKTLLSEYKPLEWMDWDNMAAAGGIISSVNDMAKWMQVQLQRGEILAADGT